MFLALFLWLMVKGRRGPAHWGMSESFSFSPCQCTRPEHCMSEHCFSCIIGMFLQDNPFLRNIRNSEQSVATKYTHTHS